jgi:uncharacterized protein (DUF924 family)
MYDDWATSADGALALVLMFDQFPRNMFRGTPRAFATDAKALHIAALAIERGFDQVFTPLKRRFLYLPFEHSENLADQEQCLALFQSLPDHPEKELAVAAAQQHHQLIAEFGRFPHRNVWLGRESTAAEQEYLQRPNAFQG